MYCEYYHAIMFIVLPSFLLGSAETKSGVRTKRILYGHEAEDRYRDAYDIFRYHVFLTKAPMGFFVEKPNWFEKWLMKVKNPGADLNYLHCSGSLLTPNIVQTACHCLADYTVKGKEDGYTYASTLNIWETRIYSYVGSNSAKDSLVMLIPKHYIVYEHCRLIEYGIDIAMMDFGLIILKDAVTKKAPNAAISYAPVYNAKDILNYYYETIRNEYMCLVAGHGEHVVYVHLDEYDDLVESVAKERSDLIRWGWRNVMNYVDCLSASYRPGMRKKHKERPFFNYTADATQVCLKAFTESKKYYYNAGGGDSGGPITCNNVYVAVQSMSEYSGPNILTYASPIAQTMFENAAEYRAELEKWIVDFFKGRETNPDVPYPLPTYPEWGPTPPPIDLHPLSQCSLVTIQHHLFVLPLTFLFIF